MYKKLFFLTLFFLTLTTKASSNTMQSIEDLTWLDEILNKPAGKTEKWSELPSSELPQDFISVPKEFVECEGLTEWTQKVKWPDGKTETLQDHLTKKCYDGFVDNKKATTLNGMFPAIGAFPNIDDKLAYEDADKKIYCKYNCPCYLKNPSIEKAFSYPPDSPWLEEDYICADENYIKTHQPVVEHIGDHDWIEPHKKPDTKPEQKPEPVQDKPTPPETTPEDKPKTTITALAPSYTECTPAQLSLPIPGFATMQDHFDLECYANMNNRPFTPLKKGDKLYYPALSVFSQNIKKTFDYKAGSINCYYNCPCVKGPYNSASSPTFEFKVNDKLNLNFMCVAEDYINSINTMGFTIGLSVGGAALAVGGIILAALLARRFLNAKKVAQEAEIAKLIEELGKLALHAKDKELLDSINQEKDNAKRLQRLKDMLGNINKAEELSGTIDKLKLNSREKKLFDDIIAKEPLVYRLSALENFVQNLISNLIKESGEADERYLESLKNKPMGEIVEGLNKFNEDLAEEKNRMSALQARLGEPAYKNFIDEIKDFPIGERSTKILAKLRLTRVVLQRLNEPSTIGIGSVLKPGERIGGNWSREGAEAVHVEPV